MKKTFTLALLAAVPFALSACCSASEARFWEVRDGASGATAYTVDTARVQLETIPTVYVDGAGRSVLVGRVELVRQMPEADWLAATSGAGYALKYCGVRKACWAAVSPR